MNGLKLLFGVCRLGLLSFHIARVIVTLKFRWYFVVLVLVVPVSFFRINRERCTFAVQLLWLVRAYRWWKFVMLGSSRVDRGSCLIVRSAK